VGDQAAAGAPSGRLRDMLTGRAAEELAGRPPVKATPVKATPVDATPVDGTPVERWLVAQWPFVRAHLPAAPASVVEIGCGPDGGLVPLLNHDDYDAVGIDPEAPDASGYHRMEFEEYEPPRPVDVVVACRSLHHVADPAVVLDRVAATLAPGGVLIVLEWASERFDEPTARWCFDRLGAMGPTAEPSWLHRRRDEWAAYGRPWPSYRQAWTLREGIHSALEIVRALDDRFERRAYDTVPYFFGDLVDTTEADERAAIDSGRIRATGVRYAATASG
jgi:SAM-dependent methyltransferase